MRTLKSVGTVFGSYPGVETIALTAPVSGSIATTAPPVSGVVIALSSACVATRCASASRVRVTSEPSSVSPWSSSIRLANSFVSPVRVAFSDCSISELPTSMNE